MNIKLRKIGGIWTDIGRSVPDPNGDMWDLTGRPDPNGKGGKGGNTGNRRNKPSKEPSVYGLPSAFPAAPTTPSTPRTLSFDDWITFLENPSIDQTALAADLSNMGVANLAALNDEQAEDLYNKYNTAATSTASSRQKWVRIS